MTLQAKTFLNLIAGAVAGLLAWALTDGTGWYARTLKPITFLGLGLPGYGLYLLYGALFGLILGLLLGVVDALSLDSPRRVATALALGAGIGFLGGGLGLHMGQSAYGWLTGGAAQTPTPTPGQFLGDMFARAIGWGVIGAIVGAAPGVARRSPTIIRLGLFGGLLGGLLGGAVFRIAATLLQSDMLSRLAALVATGALTGFFIGLVQDLFKQAWVKVMVGRNEGKEYLLATPVVTIGRNELSDIGLFGDPSIAPTHAVIESLPDQNRHRLRHVAAGAREGAYPPTVVNGRPVTSEQWLTDGDTIQIGGRTLLFQEKATRGAHPAPAPTSAPATARAPFVGEALTTVPGGPSFPEATAVRPSLTPPPEVWAQMGTVPEAAPPMPEPASVFALVDAARSGTRLTATKGPYAGQSFALGLGDVMLGRASGQDIALTADSSISRSHARVTYENGHHLIVDAGSSNGTQVNGQLVTAPRQLRVGDQVQLGDTIFRYE